MEALKEEASSIRCFIKKNLKIHAPASTGHARAAQLRGRRPPPELHACGRRAGADPGGRQPPDQGDGGATGPRPLHAQQPQHAAPACRARQLARGETRLRLSLGARFATHWLLPRLPRFRAAHPQIELSFDICDELRDFEADDIDAAIRFGTGRGAHTLAVRLFDARVIPVCTPALLQSGAPLVRPADLLAHTLCHVDCMVDGQVWPNWPMWMAVAGVEGLDARRCIAFTDSSHVVQAVLDGGAVGLVEQDLVAEDLARGRLVRLFDIGVGLGPAYAYHLVYPQRSQGQPAIEALRAWVLAEAGL
jgi:LysR family glycine cleavage system transcriptional activator